MYFLVNFSLNLRPDDKNAAVAATAAQVRHCLWSSATAGSVALIKAAAWTREEAVVALKSASRFCVLNPFCAQFVCIVHPEDKRSCLLSSPNFPLIAIQDCSGASTAPPRPHASPALAR